MLSSFPTLSSDRRLIRGACVLGLGAFALAGPRPARAETGYDLWLRHARAFAERWAALRGRVDAERHQAVLAKLHQQSVDAAQWRDKILRYFQTLSGRPSAAASPAP